jgi:hypothetical protein
VSFYGNPLEGVAKEALKNAGWEELRDLLFGAPRVAAASGKARYRQFVKAREWEQLAGRRTKGWRFVLGFDEPEALHERIAAENDHLEEDLKEAYPSYVPLALPVFSKAEAKIANPSELDEFLVVDTSSDAHPVLLWTHEGFEVVRKTFVQFVDTLERGDG